VISAEDALAAREPLDSERGEEAIDALLREAHLVGPHQVGGLLRRHAAALGATDAVAYLVDLQQTVLVPLVEPAGPGLDRQLAPLAVDSTVAGRCFQHVEVVQRPTTDGARVWLPLLNGTERLGVLGVSLAAVADLDRNDGRPKTQLLRFAAVAADVIMSRTLYGDTLVRQELGLGRRL
jgi:hypothetical protein